MTATKRRSLLGRYMREVIWGKCLQSTRRPPASYLQLSRRGNRYFYLALRFLSSPTRPCAVLSKKPCIVGPLTYCYHMDDYARLAYSHPHVQFRRQPPRKTGDTLLVHDDSDPRLTEREWGKVVRIDYDISSTSPPATPWMMMPYSMHSLIYATVKDREIHRLRNNDRTMRIFFAGNVDPQVYTCSRSMKAIRERFTMLDRPGVIASIREGLASRLQQPKSEEDLQELMAAGPARTCVLATDRSVRIGLDRWLETLSRCDVFLAPPGVFMPLCHNVIEAMAVGCVPLLNYPRWFTPRLEHMKNCIRFTGEADLIEKATMALEMEPDRLAEMRANVCDYYDRFLDPDRFLERLVSHRAKQLTLFMVTESQHFLELVTTDSVVLAEHAGEEEERTSERKDASVGSRPAEVVRRAQ